MSIPAKPPLVLSSPFHPLPRSPVPSGRSGVDLLPTKLARLLWDDTPQPLVRCKRLSSSCTAESIALRHIRNRCEEVDLVSAYGRFVHSTR